MLGTVFGGAVLSGRRVRVAYRRASGAAAGEEAVEEKEDHGSDNGYNEAAQVEPEVLWPAGKELVEKTPDESTGDAQQHSNDAAAWISPWSE